MNDGTTVITTVTLTVITIYVTGITTVVNSSMSVQINLDSSITAINVATGT